jgi:hypothetical protein
MTSVNPEAVLGQGVRIDTGARADERAARDERVRVLRRPSKPGLGTTPLAAFWLSGRKGGEHG